MPGLFPSGISGNEQFCSRRGHICVEKLQSGETAVRVASRANSLHNFLTRVTAFFVTDMGYFKRGFVRNIFVVVIVAEPCDAGFQTDRIDSIQAGGQASNGASAA